MYWICLRHETLIGCCLEAAKGKRTKEWGFAGLVASAVSYSVRLFTRCPDQRTDSGNNSQRSRLACSPRRTGLKINEAAGCVWDVSVWVLGLLYHHWCHRLTFRWNGVFFCLSPPAGIWIKPSRTSRMKEKRADFVAGWLGGRIIAAGGLGQHIYSSTSIIRTDSWVIIWKRPERKSRILQLLPSSALLTVPPLD